MTPEILVLTNNVELSTIDNIAETPEMCNCCICSQPEVVVLPESVKVCSLNCVEESSSIVTIIMMNEVVSGLFPTQELSIDCYSLKFSSSNKVKGDIKERYKILRSDPIPDPSWHMEVKSALDNMVYLIFMFVDQIPRDLGATWSQIIKRDVEQPERFNITVLTSMDMQRLRSEYIKIVISKKCKIPASLRSMTAKR